MAGVGAYKAVLEIARLEVLPSTELVALRSAAARKEAFPRNANGAPTTLTEENVISGSRAVLSPTACLDHWLLSGDMWHYSLTRANDSPVWQVGRPVFERRSAVRIVGHGVWVNTVDGSRVPYDIEVGCRGKRGVWIFTQSTPEPDAIPTIEVYPELWDNMQQQIVGYAIDQTWDGHEVLAPVMVSRKPLHGSETIGPIRRSETNNQLSQLWRQYYDRHTSKTRECTVCGTLAGSGLTSRN